MTNKKRPYLVVFADLRQNLFICDVILPKRLNAYHRINNSSLVDTADGSDLLVLSITAHSLYILKKLDVIVPNRIRLNVDPNLVQCEVIGFRHLLPEVRLTTLIVLLVKSIDHMICVEELLLIFTHFDVMQITLPEIDI